MSHFLSFAKGALAMFWLVALVNLAYPLPGGQAAQFLQDNRVYWGNQIEVPGSERCYGVVADETFLLVCRYGCEGRDPELVLYKKR